MTSPGPSSSDTGTFPSLPGDPKDMHDHGGLVGVREQFSLQESVRVLSHYDVGVITRVREYRRGSRRAPKLLITAERGEFLLKRRAASRSIESRIALAHLVQRHLDSRRFPVAPLVATRGGEDGVLLDGRSYELFGFVQADGYSKSATASASAGAILARFHATTEGMPLPSEVPTGSFHASGAVDASFRQIPAAVAAAEPEIDRHSIERSCRLLGHGYREAARRADAAGVRKLPMGIVHGDWHPGNVLYRGDSVIAVIDFDSVRLEPRISDVANGLLQFTMIMGEPDDPLAWPEGLDPRRVEAFLRGYDDESSRLGQRPLDEAEMTALPWLMIESLIVECAIPIAATGAFASIRGSAFLGMVERKVDWIWRRATRLRRLLG